MRGGVGGGGGCVCVEREWVYGCGYGCEGIE